MGSSNEVRLVDYRGASTAAAFKDPQAELEELQSGCGVCDLGYRAKLSLTGGDRVRWLNGMVTNNIRDLAEGHGLYAFLLNPQGRILGDMVVYNRGESVIVDTDRNQLEKIAATFDHYIIMDDVEVKDLTGVLTALGVCGPKSAEVLTRAGFATIPASPLQFQDVTWQGHECTLVRGEQGQDEAYEIWLAPERVRQLWDALLSAGAAPVGAEALATHRILAGIPLYGVDIRERDLPQETEQTRALNFNKGCYVGQEIVERIRSRGNVHRKFTSFAAQDGTPIAVGSKIMVNEKEVGEITSSASLPGRPTVALGYIRREHATPRKEVEIAGAKAQVVQLPLANGALSGEGLARQKIGVPETAPC
jgi:folate-binding protein YgfZ